MGERAIPAYRLHSRFANREYNEIVVLKPQDVYVALKIVATQSDRAPYSQLAAELVMSPSEVHASVQRAQASHLLHGPRLKNRPNFSASAGLSTFFRLNGEGSPVGSQRRMPRSRFAAFSRKGRILFPSGRTRRASDGASRLSRCTRRPPSRPWVTHPFTSTWPSPMPCGMAAPANEKSPSGSYAAV